MNQVLDQNKSSSVSLGKDDSEYTSHLAKEAKFITCELGIMKLCGFQVGFDLLLTLWPLRIFPVEAQAGCWGLDPQQQYCVT